MKIRLIFIITTIAIILSSCGANQQEGKIDIYVGMTFDEFNKVLEENYDYCVYGYYYYEDENGKNTVVEYDQELEKVVRIEKYEKRVASSEEFENLKQGTSMYKIVKMAGLPTINPYLSFTCMDYTSKEGDTYSLVLNPHDYTLYSCSLVENND